MMMTGLTHDLDANVIGDLNATDQSKLMANWVKRRRGDKPKLRPKHPKRRPPLLQSSSLPPMPEFDNNKAVDDIVKIYKGVFGAYDYNVCQELFEAIQFFAWGYCHPQTMTTPTFDAREIHKMWKGEDASDEELAHMQEFLDLTTCYLHAFQPGLMQKCAEQRAQRQAGVTMPVLTLD